MSPGEQGADPQAMEDRWRQLAPQVLGALLRYHRDFGIAEDAVQEALLAAAMQWPRDGLPNDPKAWLITVATRRLIDQVRRDQARTMRETSAALFAVRENEAETASHAEMDEVLDEAGSDDTLRLLLMCCHPALTPPSQIALTLRAVGGLTTAQIAAAFLVPEATMAQRISRAKHSIREAGGRFATPAAEGLPEQMRAVLHVLYLIFNEGYTATAGSNVHVAGLTREAIRLTRAAAALLADDGEVKGLLALMLLTDARSAARTTPEGDLIPLAEQDRGLWNRAAIEEGSSLVMDALSRTPLGPYQVQAAIAAVHDEAPTADETDWRQIRALYQLLEKFLPGPVVTLNQAVAVAMVDGPEAGLELLEPLAEPLAKHHRLHTVRAHLLERAGRIDEARESYLLAARLTASIPEQRYLTKKAEAL